MAATFTPAVCVGLIVIGLALQSPWWLAGMALVALSGALLPGGMVIDTLYNIGVRHLLGAPPVAPAPKPRQFSYLISTAFLSASAVIFRNAAATGPSWSSAINRSRRSSGLWQQSKTEPETQRRQP